MDCWKWESIGCGGFDLNPILPKGIGTKPVCVIKYDLSNFDEVLSKIEDGRHNI